MAFDFRLARVLELADNKKKNLEAEYQTLFRRLEDMAKKLIDLLNQREKKQHVFQNQMQKGTTIDSIKGRLSDTAILDQLIAEETRQYDRLKQQMEAYQADLLEKSIEVKKYEKLRDKKWQHYLEKKKKIQLKSMDEIAASRASDRINGVKRW
ncbi:flagellar export protein FliJ [Sporolactobacillus sp. Y61]|jgi:flagellar FliJ protein|uniref:Flagellar FliJ protein n=1 Tax=Sporolactobacillus sp. Y61 TaxID=3160863 RepID=A0AAU8ICM7_9BACL|nr:flagellar export protein FliJ [Sporolactobacillus sp. THM19-2]RYL92951.1 flagellar export protein FliJ [Sporolactobacillus sp. THM19-2]